MSSVKLSPAIAASIAVLASACATPSPPPPPASFSQAALQSKPQEYRIGPLDKVSVTVFQVPALTIAEIQVDGSGRLSLPLIGDVMAQGKTTQELAGDIANRLRANYLQSPQVAVSVVEAVSQKVTVDGAVREPGVYAMSGPTTLVQAVAMAKGPDLKLANLNHVAIFRMVDNARTVAVFDLKAIRAGKAEDPLIQGNDVIVVESSALKSTFREILGALPGLAVFRPF